MKKYELATVLRVTLEEEERAKTIKKIEDYIVRFGGNVTQIDDSFGKKKLAYEIQKMREGFYYFIQFETENADCPNELEAHIRIMEEVIRYLCIKQEE
ncbi:30S ribosomal protein S6 [Clostridia bacterium]|nr:30S ribosomal protein S6 [Clostridia bacterium]